MYVFTFYLLYFYENYAYFSCLCLEIVFFFFSFLLFLFFNSLFTIVIFFPCAVRYFSFLLGFFFFFFHSKICIQIYDYLSSERADDE